MDAAEVTIPVALPSTALAHEPAKVIEDRLRLLWALDEIRAGRMTRVRAATWLRLALDQFLSLADTHGLAAFDYEPNDVHAVRALGRASELVFDGRDRVRLAKRELRVVEQEALKLDAHAQSLAERRRVHDEVGDESERLRHVLRDVQAEGLITSEVEGACLERRELVDVEAIFRA
jgi:hypothetical protein